jgi:hypothetical protein
MTKNEDTSPWMRFPDDPKAIKRHNKLVLSSIPTADLVTELRRRHELCPVVDEMTREPVCMFVTTRKSLVTELCKRDGVEFYDTLQKNQELRIETVYYRNRFKFDTNCKILVVRE